MVTTSPLQVQAEPGPLDPSAILRDAARQERYARLAAREMFKQGRRPRFGELWWRPFFTFLKLYFLKQGFLEGSLGLALSSQGSRYNFLKYYYLRELTLGKDIDAH